MTSSINLKDKKLTVIINKGSHVDVLQHYLYHVVYVNFLHTVGVKFITDGTGSFGLTFEFGRNKMRYIRDTRLIVTERLCGSP